MKDVLSNRNPSDWLPAMAELEHAEDFGEDYPEDEKKQPRVNPQTGWLE